MGFWAEGEDITGAGGMPGQKPSFKVSQPTSKTPDYEKNRAGIMSLYTQRRDKAGPASVVAAKSGYTAPTGPGAAYQANGAAMLDAASQGKGPSVAGSVMGQGIDEALRARLAAVASARPSALAQQQAMGAAAGAMAQSASSSALAKAQEVQGATSQYGAALGAMRGADLATAQGANRVALANAQMAQQANLQNQKTALDWTAMSDAERNSLLSMLYGLDANEATNATNYYRTQWGLAAERNAINMRDQILRGQQTGQFVNGLGQAAGAAAKAYAANGGSGGGWSDSDTATLRRG